MTLRLRVLLLFVLLACLSCAPAKVRQSTLSDGGVPPSRTAPATTAQAPTPLPRVPAEKSSGLDEILNGPKGSRVFWGVSVKSLRSGAELFALNDEKLFVPASNMKLFTTAVALIRLGPGFRYTTALYSDGSIEKGVVKGDVYLKGSGDPTISERFQGRPTAVFEEWADRLKSQGIREIRGDLIGDDSLFDDRDLGPGWAWDDEFISFSARISAVSFNDNCFDTFVSPGKRPGDPAQIRVNPDTSYVKIKNSVRTSARGDHGDLDARRPFGSGPLALSGTIEQGSLPRRLRFTAGNPTLYAMTVFKEVLGRKGIEVTGKAMDIDDTGKSPDYARMRLLISRQSPPLKEIIEQTNKRSQNLYAELLFRTLGAVYKGRGTTEKSVQVMAETLAGMGITPGTLAIYDGSGLSRLNLVSPSQIVRLLDYMSRHPYFEHFYRSLPVAGVDGTLMKRMKNTEAENNVRAKTGTLTHMVSLSGYLKERNGNLLAFSIMSNNCLSSAAEVRTLQDAICERLPYLQR